MREASGEAAFAADGGVDAESADARRAYEDDLAEARAFERRLPWKEAIAAFVMALVVLAHLLTR